MIVSLLRKYSVYTLLISLFFSKLSISQILRSDPVPLARSWSHIEYGAGNYGNSIVNFNLIKRVEYRVLFRTLDELVTRNRTSRGIFYVNDKEIDWAIMAAEALKKYAQSKGWKDLEVRVFPGDMSSLDILPVTDTADLKHPNFNLIKLIRSPGFLRRIARHSRGGLHITTIFHYDLKRSLNISGIKFLASNAQAFDYTLPIGLPMGGESSIYAIPRGDPLALDTREELTVGFTIEEAKKLPQPTLCYKIFRAFPLVYMFR